MSDDEQSEEPQAGSTTRRHALMLGAVAATAVVSIRPAMASTVGSVLNCEIPVPDAGRAGNYIAADGSLVPRNTPGAFAPSPRPFTGEQVKAAMDGRSLPGTSPQQSRAYTAYIRRLQIGQSGFTCYSSLLNTRR